MTRTFEITAIITLDDLSMTTKRRARLRCANLECKSADSVHHTAYGSSPDEVAKSLCHACRGPLSRIQD
jgi:hypothetical protein